MDVSFYIVTGLCGLGIGAGAVCLISGCVIHWIYMSQEKKYSKI